jgi:hypothetical protein
MYTNILSDNSYVTCRLVETQHIAIIHQLEYGTIQ